LFGAVWKELFALRRPLNREMVINTLIIRLTDGIDIYILIICTGIQIVSGTPTA
jgi:hypothetical protein